MKKIKETKIQHQGSGSLLTTIPSFIVQLHNLEKGDKLEWSYNPDDLGDIRLRIVKK